MNVSEFLTYTNDSLRGTDEDAPTLGTDEANLWLRTLNRKKNELYRNAKVLWDETFRSTPPVETGTVATTGTTTLTGTGTFFTDYRVGDQITVSGETARTIASITSDTVLTVTVAFSNTASGKTFTRSTIVASAVSSYSVNRSLIAPSDQAYIVDTNSQNIYYDLVHPRNRPQTGRQFYLAGMNPQVLYCSNEIEATEDIVGGTLYLPGYYMPADIDTTTEDGTTVIPFSDPYYAVMAVASEVAFNDITFEDKAPDLAGKAQFLYMQMVRNNRRNTYGNARPVARDVKRIRGTEVN